MGVVCYLGRSKLIRWQRLLARGETRRVWVEIEERKTNGVYTAEYRARLLSSSPSVRIANPSDEWFMCFCYDFGTNSIVLSNILKGESNEPLPSPLYPLFSTYKKASDQRIEELIEYGIVHEYIHFLLDRDLGSWVSHAFDVVLHENESKARELFPIKPKPAWVTSLFSGR